MFLLAYRNLRTRPARTLFTALAIALGVGMIFAMRIVGVALEHSAGQARESRLAGADLEVSGAASAYLQDAFAEEIAARPEIEFAAPTYRALEGAAAPRESLGASTSVLEPAPGLRGTGLALLGVDPAHAPGYELDAGEFFATDLTGLQDLSGLQWEVILPTTWAAQHGIGVGDSVSLTTGDQTHDYAVVGLRKEQDTLTGQPTAWLPIKTMQAAFDTPGAATSLLIWLEPGTPPDSARDALQDALGSQYIVASASGAAGSASFFGTLVQLSLPFSSLAVLLTGSFLVYNAFAISLAERRREISQLRTLGMTRGQALRQTLAEALLVALAGSAVGLLLGFGLGRGLVVVFVGLLQNQPLPDVAVPLDGALLAVGAGVLITLVVTFTLARAASRVHPLEALRLDVSSAEKQGWYMRWGWTGAIGSAVICAIGIAAAQKSMESGSGESGFALSFLPTLALAGLTLFALPLAVRGALWIVERLTSPPSPALRATPPPSPDASRRERGEGPGVGGEGWQLTFVDFGMVGHVPPNLRAGLREAVIAIGTRDSARLVKSYQMLGVLLPHADLALLERAEAKAFERFWGKSMTELRQLGPQQMLEFATEFRELIYTMPFQIPEDLIFLGRTVAILSGMCTGLDPHFNVWTGIAPYAQKLIAEEAAGGWEFWLGELETLARALLSLPKRTEAVLSQIERGELAVRIPQIVERLDRLEVTARRTVGGMIFAGLLVSGVQLYLAGQMVFGGVLLAGAALTLGWVIFSQRGR